MIIMKTKQLEENKESRTLAYFFSFKENVTGTQRK